MTSAAHVSHVPPPDTPQPYGLLHDLVREQSLRTPDAPAVTDGATTLDYRQLQDRADAVADWLSAEGCGPGTLVGVALNRSADALVAVLGVLNAGAGYVPLDPGYPAQRLRAVLDDARPRLVLAADGERISRMLGPQATVVPLDSLPAGPAAATGDGGRAVPDPESPAYVIHTSGSTGRPKGVVVPHRAIRSRVLWEASAFPSGPGDSVLHRTSLAFDISLQEIFPPLACGGRVVIADDDGQRDPARLVQLIAAERITTVALVPSLLRALLDEDEGLLSCGHLREVFVGGERLDRSLHDRFLSGAAARLHNMYGPTEYAIDATAWTCRPLEPGEEVPIGFPLERTELYVLDDDLRAVPDGSAGQLAVSGDQLALGYLNDPELTEQSFPANPLRPGTRMYLTGDVVRRRPDGALAFLGRHDDQVKIRGHRIELGDVESQLRALPGVRDAAATAVAGPDGSVLVGYVVPGAERPDAVALRRNLAELAPAPLVPAHIVVLEALPLGPTGKIDRSALPLPDVVTPDPADHGSAAPTANAAPGSGEVAGPEDDTTGAAVTEVFQEVLRRPSIGPDDDFFDLGGNSLQAARLVNLLRKRLGKDLPLAALFETSTPAGIAAALRDDLP